MACILRTCVFTKKRLLFDDFSNLGRTLTYIVHNGRNLEKFSPVYNIRYCSTKDSQRNDRIEIYYGTLTKQIRNLKLFSLLTSTGGLLMQPFIYTKVMENANIAGMGIFAFIGLLAVTTPLLLHIVTKKYVTRVYYDAKEDKYIANTYSLFVRKKELVFTPDDVVVPDVTGMFTNCIIKKKPLFLEQDFFHDSSHYIRIMGYDKPIDFKLNNNDNNLNEPATINSHTVEYKNNTNKK